MGSTLLKLWCLDVFESRSTMFLFLSQPLQAHAERLDPKKKKNMMPFAVCVCETGSSGGFKVEIDVYAGNI